jgi:SAM-dependent methyltransferase
VPAGASGAAGLPATAEEFHAALGYDALSFETAEQFLAYAATDWVQELRDALRPLLRRDRSILSVGSGKGELEVPLFLEGYDVTASDIDGRALEDARRLFPGFDGRALDVLAPGAGGETRWGDLMAPGLDYALDDEQLRRFLAGARELLLPGGRVLLVLRYQDNVATRAIDRVLIPLWFVTRRVRHRLRRDGIRVATRPHGWRRTRGELARLSEQSGYRVGSVRHALFGRELLRVPLPASVRRGAARADRRLHLFTSATIFELHPE